MSNILLVEDEALIRSSLKRLLERNHYSVSEAASVAEACERYSLQDFDLLISDVRLAGDEPGTELIARARPTPVLIMTSFGNLKSAVEAMKMGAVDYISKPFDHDEMLMAIERILREKTLKAQNEALKQTIERDYPTTGMIGKCAAMQEVFNRIRKVAPLATTVLIRGESGTGKELVARALHEQSLRANGPLISVNCAAIPETLIESELFGAEKGSFTGAQANRKGLVEAADGGTLFLDEIGELPLEAQARLLRLLQEKEVRRIGSTQAKRVDVRLVAATHRDLKKLAGEGRFREDLYYRLHVVELLLPPLRDRGDDILELADTLLARTAQRLGVGELHFGPEARLAMTTYNWPGNVRELENAIERAAILCESSEIMPEHLAIDYARQPSVSLAGSRAMAAAEPPTGLSLEDYFQHFVLEHQDHMSETELAQKLGISRKSLWERRQRLGIPRRKPHEGDPLQETDGAEG
ncbi:MAG TPA: sigma-54 dependent transcriptional regulator [Moraxellaceae bacterium]|nr:sigma-54 dependent transcriptional regulator [Moraxellaceae bacterium]